MNQAQIEALTPRAAQEALAAVLTARDGHHLLAGAARAYVDVVRAQPEPQFARNRSKDEWHVDHWSAVAWTYHPHICSPAARGGRHTVRSLLKSRIADAALDLARSGRALDEKAKVPLADVSACYALDELLERLAYNLETQLFAQEDLPLAA